MEFSHFHKYTDELTRVKRASFVPQMAAPTPKKKSFWKPALAAGALAVGGGYLADKYMNGGRAVSSIQDWFSNRLGKPQTPAPAPVVPSSEHEAIWRDPSFKAKQDTHVLPAFQPNDPVAELQARQQSWNNIANFGLKDHVDKTFTSDGLPKGQFDRAMTSTADRFAAPMGAAGIGMQFMNSSKYPGIVPAGKGIGMAFGAQQMNQVARSPLAIEALSDPAPEWWNPISKIYRHADPKTVDNVMNATSLPLGAWMGSNPYTMFAPSVLGSVMRHGESKLRSATADSHRFGNIADALLTYSRDAKHPGTELAVRANGQIAEFLDTNKNYKETFKSMPSLVQFMNRLSAERQF